MAETWTLVPLIRTATEYLQRHGVETPRLDAEVLLARVLSMERIGLYLSYDQPVSESDLSKFRELIRRRAKERVPVAYLTESREFWSLSFRVTPSVLIPRPDTETLVRVSLAIDPAPRRILDWGTGSGCIAAALAHELPEAMLVGADISPGALDLAGENVASLGFADRIDLVLCEKLSEIEGRFDLIVSNPPYIPSAELDALAPELRWEPRLALDGGRDGLDGIRCLIESVPERLARPGWLLLEVGQGQAPAVADLLVHAGAAETMTHPDLAGIPRVVGARFGGDPGSGLPEGEAQSVRREG
jgi:release factor glutamine methyltransferase